MLICCVGWQLISGTVCGLSPFFDGAFAVFGVMSSAHWLFNERMRVLPLCQLGVLVRF